MAFVLHEDEETQQSPRIAAEFDVQRPLKPAPSQGSGKRGARLDTTLAPADK